MSDPKSLQQWFVLILTSSFEGTALPTLPWPMMAFLPLVRIIASTANDTVSMANLGGFVTAASVYGGDGNDIISFAAVGITASARTASVYQALPQVCIRRIYMVQPHIPAQKPSPEPS